MSKISINIYIFIIFRYINSTFPIQKYLTKKNKDLLTKDALDLLNKMLEVDHSLRITAKDALEHPYLKIKNNNSNI